MTRRARRAATAGYWIVNHSLNETRNLNNLPPTISEKTENHYYAHNTSQLNRSEPRFPKFLKLLKLDNSGQTQRETKQYGHAYFRVVHIFSGWESIQYTDAYA